MCNDAFKMMAKELNQETLENLYAWIDKIPLSRRKKNIARDFSDGVMAAEVVKHYFPKLVDLYNYSPAHSAHQKLSNWTTLNRKVFSRLNFHVPEDSIRKIVSSTPGVIEAVLCVLQERIENKTRRQILDGRQDLEYYNTSNGKWQEEHTQILPMTDETPTLRLKKEDQMSFQRVSPGPVTEQSLLMDPALQVLVEEKDQALLALQETAESLRMKVSRLEHLLHLKDLHIEDLTRHVERYKRQESQH